LADICRYRCVSVAVCVVLASEGYPRAVVNGPKLLLADEPTASLDDAAAEAAIGLLIAQAARAGAALIVATHDARVKRHFEKELLLKK